MILVTVDSSHVAPTVIAAVRTVIALGRHPVETLRGFATAIGETPPHVVAAEDGAERRHGLFWERGQPEVRPFEVWPSETERRRHRRKYAEGDLGPSSFYFRGPAGALNLRAQNVQMFAQLAAGVDEATWLYHLRRGDIARWMADCVKDSELATEVAAIAADEDMPPAQSRTRVIEAVSARLHGACLT